jgi:hypothetical protein
MPQFPFEGLHEIALRGKFFYIVSLLPKFTADYAKKFGKTPKNQVFLRFC